MGIIKALTGAIGGGLADSWLEVIESAPMGDNTVFTRGIKVRKGDSRNQNTKGTADTVSNGSIIHVYDNQFMMLVDGGKVVDYTAEPGYFKVDNSSMPSLFGGQFGDSLKETFSRIKYGGTPSSSQKVFFINLQEIKGIKFGTRTPINYFDCFYNSELFLRAHGTYSIKVTEPLKFYAEAIPRNAESVDINDINEQYLNEFLEALQAAINQMSADGTRISFVTSKARELSKYMANVLDEEWNQNRGMQVQSVGIGSLSYDEESQKLINMRNQGAMLSDPSVREGYVQGAIARGVEAAGSNTAGAGAAFMGVGLGMNAAGNMAGAFSASNQQQMQYQQAQQQAQQQQAQQGGWKCSCGATNGDNMAFCPGCGSKKPAPKPAEGGWTCSCGATNGANMAFCPNCGSKKPAEAAAKSAFCPNCGAKLADGAKFCVECGTKLN
ncbi:MAG: SPFH domain-containing protein [Eubacteriales bacterium]|nr:SPFH domain-containing protein [Eubacteriales bacterium]MCI6670105.1 zinc-ribbon domain-containing protein [Christensenellaceae bacterium]MCI6942803.1 zinc-ribbon domain-containing protein [Christensenellaceae bacterium]MDY3976174.1 zinc-ribbon domain-containing protein [Eubacteriales bacterium]MDY4695561.1 zinc-ribbon domain-containing protein [Eubacteriales bacterium]